jgi:hypothetical protein
MAISLTVPGVVRVDQRRIPVIQIAAEVLEQHKRWRDFAGVAIRILDPVRGVDHPVGTRRVVAGGR